MLNAKIVVGVAVALVGALESSQSAAQFIEGQALVQAREVAAQSLRNYVAGVVKEDNAARLGFKTLAEAQTAQLGEPIPVFFIRLTDLKAYRAGSGAGSVLTNARTLWFPVLVNGEVRSKLEISEVHGKWVAGEFGRPATARDVSGVHGELPTILQKVALPAGARVTLVRIPALHVQAFYASGTSGDFFVPVRQEGLPDSVEVGKAYPADALLVRLAVAAKAVDEKTVD